MEKSKNKNEDVITFVPEQPNKTTPTNPVQNNDSDIAKVSDAAGKIADASGKVAEEIRKSDEAYANAQMESEHKKDVLKTREKEKTKRFLIGALCFTATLVVGILTAGRVKLKLNS
jgi:Ca2+-dependent lipid-binding protein